VPGGEDQSPEGPEQPYWRRRLQKAYDRPTYPEAKAALKAVLRELEQENPSAAASLEEGMEETLALHRLGVYAILDLSFKTTTCLETTNALVEER
jgi:transposase-like protein